MQRLGKIKANWTIWTRVNQCRNLKQAFYNCKGRAFDIINNANTPRGQTTESNKPNSPGTSLSDSVDLPKIQLLIFSRAYEDWSGFADQFRYTVHENSRIDDCKRLMYLRSCLTQEVVHAIVSLGNTAANYSIVWEILKKRYNQPAKIVAKHLKELFDIAPLQRTSYRDLQSYSTKLEAHYTASDNRPQIQCCCIYSRPS